MDDDSGAAWARRLAATRPEVGGLVVLLVLALGLLAGLWLGSNPAASRPPTSASVGDGVVGDTSLRGPLLVVHVTGAVRTPGVVTVADGARVADVVSLAGGALPGADLGGLNLARLVVDGEQVLVPRLRAGDGGDADVRAAASAFRADGRLDLNAATADDLQTLSGIGPVLAARIVRHRDDHGPFASTGDLRAVPGIGEKTFQAIADLVVV